MRALKLWLRDGLCLLGWLIVRLVQGQARGVRILVYHSIADLPPRRDPWRMAVPPSLFAQQLAWLRRWGCTVVSLEAAVSMVRGERAIPPRAVAVTFDDGFADAFTQAYPHLQRQQVSATFFVVPSYLDQTSPFPWLAQLGTFGRPFAWDELAQIIGKRGEQNGLLATVGSHAWSHRPLSDLPVDQQREEVERSKAALESRLGAPIRWFAYPYGNGASFTAETIRALQQSGYEAACTNVMGTNRAGDSVWMLRRTRIGWEDGSWRFRWKLAGVYDWLDAWRNRRGLRRTRQALEAMAASGRPLETVGAVVR